MDNNLYRQRRVALGLCRDCNNVALPDHIYCEYHLKIKNEYERTRYAIRRKQSKCPRCGCYIAGGLYLCSKCLNKRNWEERRKYAKKERQRRIEQRRCPQCGRPLIDEEITGKRCYTCLSRSNNSI